jgi:hypothetical protein
MVRMKWDCRLSTGLPPSSWLRRLWSRKGDQQRAWNGDRKAVWDQVGLSHCRHEGLVTVRDKAHLRRDHNDDQSHRCHQCSKTALTGESRFHISTPQGIWTQVPCDRKQRVSPLHQWDMVRMKGDCRLSTRPWFSPLNYYSIRYCLLYPAPSGLINYCTSIYPAVYPAYLLPVTIPTPWLFFSRVLDSKNITICIQRQIIPVKEQYHKILYFFYYIYCHLSKDRPPFSRKIIFFSKIYLGNPPLNFWRFV